MTRTAGALIIAALALGVASAHADVPPAQLQQAFGNTILSTYPDGRTARLWLQPNGAYTAQGRRGDPSSGHWKIKGQRICLSQSRPFAAPFAFCTAVPSGGIGAVWSARAVTGETIRVKIVQGRM
jgi:hypothetical protein